MSSTNWVSLLMERLVRSVNSIARTPQRSPGSGASLSIFWWSGSVQVMVAFVGIMKTEMNLRVVVMQRLQSPQ